MVTNIEIEKCIALVVSNTISKTVNWIKKLLKIKLKLVLVKKKNSEKIW
jgi:hypothetical protein